MNECPTCSSESCPSISFCRAQRQSLPPHKVSLGSTRSARRIFEKLAQHSPSRSPLQSASTAIGIRVQNISQLCCCFCSLLLLLFLLRNGNGDISVLFPAKRLQPPSLASDEEAEPLEKPRPFELTSGNRGTLIPIPSEGMAGLSLVEADQAAVAAESQHTASPPNADAIEESAAALEVDQAEHPGMSGEEKADQANNQKTAEEGADTNVATGETLQTAVSVSSTDYSQGQEETEHIGPPASDTSSADEGVNEQQTRVHQEAAPQEHKQHEDVAVPSTAAEEVATQPGLPLPEFPSDPTPLYPVFLPPRFGVT